MAQVTVTINGRGYPVACDEGEQARITELARYVDAKVRGFARELGQIGEARLLVLAALVPSRRRASSPPAWKISPSASRRLRRSSKRPTFRVRMGLRGALGRTNP